MPEPTTTAAAPRACGCRTDMTTTDSERHAAFHALVIAQGGPAGAVNAETVRAARGFGGNTPVGLMPYMARKAADD